MVHGEEHTAAFGKFCDYVNSIVMLVPRGGERGVEVKCKASVLAYPESWVLGFVSMSALRFLKEKPKRLFSYLRYN